MDLITSSGIGSSFTLLIALVVYKASNTSMEISY
jgi:hypothetical protein